MSRGRGHQTRGLVRPLHLHPIRSVTSPEVRLRKLLTILVSLFQSFKSIFNFIMTYHYQNLKRNDLFFTKYTFNKTSSTENVILFFYKPHSHQIFNANLIFLHQGKKIMGNVVIDAIKITSQHKRVCR